MNLNAKHKHTNSLIKETSPYLLQHAHNPVNWYPWGEEAFDLAKRENKLVLISIGYAACHWCHVMERESFENEAIAQLMNELYVCIKVDREERPDIDNIYMNAVQLLTGSGGWPLNCFALPDGRPVYGGTYFNPSQWKNVLVGLNGSFQKETDKVLKAADDLTLGINNINLITNQDKYLPDSKALKAGLEQWKTIFDNKWGGNNRAPKFPMPVGLQLMQEYAFHYNDEEVKKHLENTLNRMADGGIYDQVGGAFSRYSVDSYWKVPHFEKMLYDNGQLISVYANAFKYFKEPKYARIVEQTIGFVESDMKSPQGGYYSSYDADSEGVEGKYYVWSHKELLALLDEDEHWVVDYYNVTETGNWEGENILWITDRQLVKDKFGYADAEIDSTLDVINSKLLNARKKRIAPGLDNKIITSWNALLGIGFLDAYAALQKKEHLNKAIELAKFFETHLMANNKQLYRTYASDENKIDAFLEDYALTIKFYLKLYQNTYNESYLNRARSLTDFVVANFYDTESSLFFYTHKDAKGLVSRTMDVSDNVIPSSNAVMAHNLLDVSILIAEDTYRALSEQMLKNVIDVAQQNMSYYACWGSLWLRMIEPQYEAVFCGEKAQEMTLEFQKDYYPNVLFAGTSVENNSIDLLKNRWIAGKNLIYVCKNRSCLLPVDNVESAFDGIK